jgi:hypothetical protein
LTNKEGAGMKVLNYIAKGLLFSLFIFAFIGCSTLKGSDKTVAKTDNEPMYEEGMGRAGLTLAILRPESNGLSPDEEKYLDIIQGSLNSDFNKFSAIQLFDSKNLETILEQQQLSLSGNYSDSDYIRIGQLSQSRFILTAALIKTGNAEFDLTCTITDLETGNIAGNFWKQVKLRDIINSNASRAVAADLLSKLGVVFTPAGKEALLTEKSAEEAEAQNALALSYEASRSGNLIDALIYSYTASNADKNSVAAKNQAEVAFKMMGGTGTKIKEDIRQQGYWKKNLIDFENFYRNHPPFEVVYTSIPVMKGTADYDRGTVDFEFTVGMRHKHIKTMQNVLDDILKELRKTNYKKNQWDFNKWPVISAKSTRSNQIITSIFAGYRTFTIRAALIDNNDATVASLEFPLYGQLFLKTGNLIGAVSTQERRMAITVNSRLITDDMKIRIISIDGIDADKSNVDAYVKNSIVAKMPVKSGASISKKHLLLPELPEEMTKRLAVEQKAKTRQEKWDSKALKSRKNIYGTLVYNSSIMNDWQEALAIEGGLGFGYKNLSVDVRIIYPINSLMNQSGGAGELLLGIGAAGGYSYVWDHFLLSLEGGVTYFRDNNDNSFGVLPTLEGKLDMTPWQTGLAFRLAYKLEFGSPDNGKFYEAYFGENNSFGWNSFRMTGSPSAGIVIWY